MFFANDQRDNVREENQGISFGKEDYLLLSYLPLPGITHMLICVLLRSTGQVGKVLGEKWKALSAKQREPYEAKAKADKERYESEKASYNVRIRPPVLHDVRRPAC